MRLAIVTPWFGRSLRGGAEQHAWELATRLAARGHKVNVLTTCCRSHQDDWATNHLDAGELEEPEGFTVRRFPVDGRDRLSFDRVASYLMQLKPKSLLHGVSPVSPADSQIFAHELIKSKALIDCLREEKDSFDWFILLPYLYGPVLQGVELLREKAALLPCLHNEAYAYLPEIANAFRDAGRLLFISEGEQELAFKLFGPGIWEKAHLVGGGVEVGCSSKNGRHARQGSNAHGRYVLYLGRKDAGKNVPLMLKAFARFRAVRPNSNLQLLLAGNGSVHSSLLGKGVEDLGLVDEEQKQALLEDCLALFQPSQNESFSRVIMEAWRKRKPVVVHGDCLATAVAVQKSGGGWIARSEEEWAQRFVDVARASEEELAELGVHGEDYASTLADWDAVIARCELALAQLSDRGPSASRNRACGEINQFLPNLSFGDAISNHALWIRDQLRDLGYRSEIFARFVDPRLAGQCHVFTPASLTQSAAIIYHHSIGSEITPHVLDYPGRKCLIYHNITPAEFFAPYWPAFAAIVKRGRDDLSSLSQHFALSVGDSDFNAAELREKGFVNPGTLPIAIDPGRWRNALDSEMMQTLQDGRTNLLFVGRIAPNKKQDDLLRAFEHYLSFDPDARLILTGKAEESDPYGQHLKDTIQLLGLDDSVVQLGSVTEAQLAACYRCAHLFWSMSEHEGFCVPLIEAMWFDLPVFAYRSTAVPETLGSGGLLFNDKSALREVAAAAHLLRTDDELRRLVVKQQRLRREVYLPSRVRTRLEQLASDLTGT